MENFLLGLNTLTSRGIPVGPTPSVIIAELVASDIDKKILTYTRDFVRWVDDIAIFFETKEDAERVLHELTAFIHENHRLVLSGEKTRIVPVDRFIRSMRDQEAEEKAWFKTRAKEQAMAEYYEELVDKIAPYGDFNDAFDEERYQTVLNEIQRDRRYEILSEFYLKVLTDELGKKFPEFAVIRNMLRKAGKYRIRSILPLLLKHFDRLLPLVREMTLYLVKVLTKDLAKKHRQDFRKIVESERVQQLPFVNMWVSTLLEHPAFNDISLPNNYEPIRGIRSRALIAIRGQDRTLVKDYKNAVDTLGPWEKRAVLFSSVILSKDERRAWMRVAAKRGDALEIAVSKFVAASPSVRQVQKRGSRSTNAYSGKGK
jgi:hypothetical protein